MNKVPRLSEDELNALAVECALDKVYMVNSEEAVRLSFGHLFGLMEEGALSKEVIDQIGAIYERYEKASPRGINGYPFFFSMRFVHKEDLPVLLDKIETKKKAVNDA